MFKKSNQVPRLPFLLSTGADERIFIDEKELTYYGTPLVNTRPLLNRGSCTGNPACQEEVELINRLIHNLNNKADWIEYQEFMRTALKEHIDPEQADAFELFFAPSGTDLIFYPLIFARLMYPGYPLMNIMTCLEELGSGAKLAAQGKFFGSFNQFGKRVDKEEPVSPELKVETVYFRARSEGGEILDHQAEIIKLVEEHPEHRFVINLVYGSKSGIEDNLSLIDKIPSARVLWTVDLCQFRHRGAIISRLIEKGAMLMITGSKFYQAPPFCAAMLVPKFIVEGLRKIEDWSAASDFGKVFSKFDWPASLRPFLDFPEQLSGAGVLRWACALEEIKKFNTLPTGKVERVTHLWWNTMVSAIEACPHFELMPFQEKTSKTIISFRVKKDGRYLDHQELKKLYRSIVIDDYSATYPFENLVIGQPVAYTNSSFLRLAIGSKNVREMIEQKEVDFELDYAVLDIIRAKLNTFGTAG